MQETLSKDELEYLLNNSKLSEITKKLNCHKNVIYRLIKKYCIKYNRQDLNHNIFINKMKNINSNIKIIGKYFGAKTSIECKCLICNEIWFPLPTSLLQKHGCPNCKKYSQNDIIKILIKKNIALLDNYTKLTKTHLVKCNVCNHIWNINIKNVIYYDSSCPNCCKTNRYNGVYKNGDITNNYKEYNLSKLLQEENEAYYWIGFLMADGHFYENGRIKLELQIEDNEHVKNFAKYIEYKKEITNSKIYVMQKKNTDLIKNKFNITNLKTYEPCNIYNIKDDSLFLSLLIGFIDGDGNIINQYKRKDKTIRIKVYKTWSDNLIYFVNRLYQIVGEEYKGNIHLTGNYTYITFSNKKVTEFLHKQTINLKIPALNRKWRW